ncbi:NAD-dependent epimerase/dehydratase family protein [Ensifer sp. MPMI2T]|nr:NAD-dependent epimerase/dehydratase family protein [Ensifer sp. MPMI2T]
MPRAVIVGGTGQIGLAAARRLVGEAWEVTVVSRHPKALPDNCRHIECDARDAEKLRAVVGSDTDLLMSCVAFDAADAECLALAGRAAGRIVAISSASVYHDDDGRTLDEASGRGFPAFSVPLTEKSPTVAPGPETYSTRKVAMERALLNRAACPTTILRPCAIHGPESKHAREWWLVKRLLDGRAAIPLAYGGQSQFQTTSVAAIADAVGRAVVGDLPAIANVYDADSPTVAEICRGIMDAMGVQAELIGLPDAPAYPPKLGATPWSIPQPMIVRGAASAEATYAQSVEPAVRWLVQHVGNDNWRERLPQLAAYPKDHFDYEADERALRLPGAVSLAA